MTPDHYAAGDWQCARPECHPDDALAALALVSAIFGGVPAGDIALEVLDSEHSAAVAINSLTQCLDVLCSAVGLASDLDRNEAWSKVATAFAGRWSRGGELP